MMLKLVRKPPLLRPSGARLVSLFGGPAPLRHEHKERKLLK
jgi:hypothetical protein